jgi:hypothetical protein
VLICATAGGSICNTLAEAHCSGFYLPSFSCQM